MEPYLQNCKELFSDLKNQDKSLRLKRRWLMDLALSESEQKRMKKENLLTDKTIPETLIREDDIYYDKVRIFVERGFGDLTKEAYFFRENLQHCGSYGSLNNISSLLHKMTNHGLCCLADLVTDGTVEYEKTRSKMKKIISDYLPTFLSQRNNNFQMRNEKVTNLLKDPKYFHGNHTGLCSPAEAFHAAAIGVLNRLELLPPQTLRAMHRKLKGKRGYIPTLEHKQSSRKRDLIGPVRNCCMKMLFELDETEEPQEPLVKALGVAGLTLKLILGCPYVIEFQKFSPEVEALQNDIAKAIGLINSEKKVSFVKLEALCKKLHNIWDVKFKFSNRSLRSAIRNLFIEYLLECSDMDIVPEYLLEALFEINTCHLSSRSSSKEEIEEEVECLLCLSAQIKQIVWDIHPKLEVDLEFSDAYMEGMVESDADDADDDDDELELPKTCKFHSSDSAGLTESVGDANPDASESPVTSKKADRVSSVLLPSSVLNIKLETTHFSEEKDSVQSREFSHYEFSPKSKLLDREQCFNGNKHHLGGVARSIWPDLQAFGSPANQNQSEFFSTPSVLEGEGGHEIKGQQPVNGTTENVEFLDSGPRSGRAGILYPKQCTNGNQYLSIQKACDETTMAMYRIIGSMLNEFARAEHLDLTRDVICYLKSHAHYDSKVSEDQQATCQSVMYDSVLIHVLEELIPSFPERAKEGLMKLMCYS